MVSSPAIVCAVDATEPARLAARCAGWLAGELGASLELVYVLDPGAMPAVPPAGLGRIPALRADAYAIQEADLRIRAYTGLDAIAGELPGIRVSTRVCEGRPVPVLHELAAERRATMLASGTAARRGLEHVLQGSVAGALAADAPCPVMMVSPGAAVAETGPVFVGDDGSEHGRRASRHAASLAERLGRELVRLQVADGDPVGVIADAARVQRACLIVVGTRGHGPVRAELFGSVSTGLVQTAARPVVLVPAGAGEPA